MFLSECFVLLYETYIVVKHIHAHFYGFVAAESYVKESSIVFECFK